MSYRTTVSGQSAHAVRSDVSKIRSRRRAFASLVAAVTLVDCTSHLRGATQTWTWSPTASSSWNNAANWTPNTTFPSNGNAGISDFTVIIPSVATQPTLNVSATIDDLTLNSGATLSILGSNNFTLNGSAITDNGAIIVNSNNSPSSDLTFTTATLSGTGTITLNSSNSGAVVAGTLTQASPHTINGLGEITAALTNNGTVDANVSGQALTLLTSAMSNNALMEATGGGNLNISGITITQGAAGNITASGTSSLVNLVAGATISGGTFNSSSGGIIEATNSSTDTIANLTNNATFNILGASNLNVTGNLVNTGTVTVNSNNSSRSAITFSGGTLSGAGQIILNNGGYDAVLAGTVTQSSTHTISGWGEITAALTNNGTVNANVSGEALLLLHGPMANNSLMEATGGGNLDLRGITVTQVAPGQIAASGGAVYLTYTTITGGTLNGNPINSAGFTNTLGGLTNNAMLNVFGASNLNISSAIVNNGVLNVDSNNSGFSTVTASGVLTGTGTININPGGTFAFAQNVGGSTQASLSIASGGRLDLDNNHMFINYGTGPDPIASIAAWIASGYNGGAWNGTGIMSTAAQSNSGSYGIGYADSADPGNPAGLASGQIEVMYTLLGDANLDGAVNGSDFAILATNFNKAVSGWDAGDFNYDGAANGSDFALLASNFNKGASQAALSSGDSSALSSFASNNVLLTSVPEPASAAMMVMAGLGILRRRRRSSRR